MKQYQVQLTKAERESLQKLIASGSVAARKLTRARILFKVDSSGPALSAAIECSMPDHQYSRLLYGGTPKRI